MAQFEFNVDVSQAIVNLQKLISKGNVTAEELNKAIKSGIKPIDIPINPAPLTPPSGFFSKFKDGFEDIGKQAAGFITGGLAIQGIQGIGQLFKGALDKGLEKLESLEGLKLGLRQAKLEGEALDNEVKRIADNAVVLGNKFAVSPTHIREVAASVGFLGGQSGEANDRITKLAIGIEEASKATGGMIGANMIVRLFTRGLNDPEAVANLGRLKMMFPGLATALKNVTKPAEMAVKAMEYLGPTFNALQEKAEGPAGSMKKFKFTLDDLEASAGVLLVNGLTPLMQALSQGAIWVKENMLPVLEMLGRDIVQNKEAFIAFGLAITAAFAPWLAVVGAVINEWIHLREVYDNSAASQLKNVEAQEKMLQAQVKQKEEAKKQAEGFEKLASAYEELGRKTNRTVQEEREFRKVGEEINQQYPNTIKGGVDLATNLDALATSAQKAQGDIGELTANISALEGQEKELAAYKLNLEVNVAKEEVEKKLADATGNALNKITEVITGGSTARTNAEKFVQPFADMVYKAATSSQLTDAQHQFMAALQGSGVDPKGQQEALNAFAVFVKKREAILTGEKEEKGKGSVVPTVNEEDWKTTKSKIDKIYDELQIGLINAKLKHKITQEEYNQQEAENEVRHQKALIAAAKKSQDVSWEEVTGFEVKLGNEKLKLDKINAENLKKQNEHITSDATADNEKKLVNEEQTQRQYDLVKAQIQLDADQLERTRQVQFNEDTTKIDEKLVNDRLAIRKLELAEIALDNTERKKVDDKAAEDEFQARMKREESFIAMMDDSKKKEIAKENHDSEIKLRAIWDAAGKEIDVDLDLYNKKLLLREDYIREVSIIDARAHQEEYDQLQIHAHNLAVIQQKQNDEEQLVRESALGSAKNLNDQFFGWMDKAAKDAGQNQLTIWYGIQSTLLNALKDYLSKKLTMWVTENILEAALEKKKPGEMTGTVSGSTLTLVPSSPIPVTVVGKAPEAAGPSVSAESASSPMGEGSGITWGGWHKDRPGVFPINQKTLIGVDPGETIAIMKNESVIVDTALGPKTLQFDENKTGDNELSRIEGGEIAKSVGFTVGHVAAHAALEGLEHASPSLAITGLTVLNPAVVAAEILLNAKDIGAASRSGIAANDVTAQEKQNKIAYSYEQYQSAQELGENAGSEVPTHLNGAGFYQDVVDEAPVARNKLKTAFYDPLKDDAKITSVAIKTIFDDSLGVEVPKIEAQIQKPIQKTEKATSDTLDGVKEVRSAVDIGETIAAKGPHMVSSILSTLLNLISGPGPILSMIVGGLGNIFGFAEGVDMVTNKRTMFMTSENNQMEHVRVTPYTGPGSMSHLINSHNAVASVNNAGGGSSSVSSPAVAERSMQRIASAVEKLHTKIETVTTVNGQMVAKGDAMYSAIAHSTLTSQITRA